MRLPFLVFVTIPILVSCSDDKPPGATCDTPVVLDGAPAGALRYELLASPPKPSAMRVPLQAGDAGHLLMVYPTTESDAWGDGGALAFVDASGEVIYDSAGLCVAEFASLEWAVPASASAVDLFFPRNEFTTVLFTVVIMT